MMASSRKDNARFYCVRLTAADIELRKIKHIPIFLANLPFLFPIIFSRSRSGRSLTWEEIKYIVYLRGWPRLIRQQSSNDGTVILLDHGPVFKMATLNAFGPERLKNRDLENWWRNMFSQWAGTLDLVIWLDAPDTILMERINNRDQRHAVKEKSEQEVSNFLDCYRSSYEYILTKLKVNGKPNLLQFDTSQASIEQIANQLLVACGVKIGESSA
jgi:hypothetical protein